VSRNQIDHEYRPASHRKPGAIKGHRNVNTGFPLDHTPPGTNREREPLGREGAVRTITSEELFRGAQEIAIAHAGSFYRLKITRQGKLILNK
jgi:hemin uptake protein HemP